MLLQKEINKDPYAKEKKKIKKNILHVTFVFDFHWNVNDPL